MGELIAQEPLWLRIWITWLAIANFASVLFLVRFEGGRLRLGRPEPLVVLLAMLGNVFFMSWLFEQVGYVRLLGLSHVIFWTPLLFFLWRQRTQVPSGTATGAYLWTVGATDAVSLVVDYVDVARFLLGDRGPLG
jgi:hypothetical protein